MLIDAHNHPNWHGHDADRIMADMERHGIDLTWLFSWELPVADYDPSCHGVLPPGAVGIPLADVLEVGRAAPDRFVLGYMPDVRQDHPPQRPAPPRRAPVVGTSESTCIQYSGRAVDRFDRLIVLTACTMLT